MGKSDAVELRERVLALVAHIRTEPPPIPDGPLAPKVRELLDRYVPVLRRYAAGDCASMDRVHLALEAVETAAAATSNDALFARAASAAKCAWPRCSVDYQEEMNWLAVMGFMHFLGSIGAEDGRSG
jgi:hypothetical protein